MSLRFVEAVSIKDKALQTAIRAFAIIRFGGSLTGKEAKLFIEICSLALPNKYRFTREQWEIMEQNIQLSLSEKEKP